MDSVYLILCFEILCGSLENLVSDFKIEIFEMIIEETPTICESPTLSPLVRRASKLCSPRNRFEVYDSLDREEEEEECEEAGDEKSHSRYSILDLKPRFLQVVKKIPGMLAKPEVKVLNSTLSSSHTTLEISWRSLSETKLSDLYSFHVQKQDLKTGMWKMCSNQSEEISDTTLSIQLRSDIPCRVRFRVRGKSKTCGSVGPWSRPSKACRRGLAKTGPVVNSFFINNTHKYVYK